MDPEAEYIKVSFLPLSSFLLPSSFPSSLPLSRWTDNFQVRPPLHTELTAFPGSILKYKWTAGGHGHLRRGSKLKEKDKDKQAEDDPG